MNDQCGRITTMTGLEDKANAALGDRTFQQMAGVIFKCASDFGVDAAITGMLDALECGWERDDVYTAVARVLAQRKP